MSRRGGRSARGERLGASGTSRSRALPESVATLRIDSIASGGDGVGRFEGMACFVPRTAPGDVAQVALRQHARHARGRVLQLLEPSPLRVDARCQHYEHDRCGGCQLQHLTDDAQRDARRTIVRDALGRIGHRDVPVPELVSGEAWGYRGRLTLTLKPRGQQWVGGLHPYDDPSRVFALDECPIAHPSLVAAWHAIRAVARGLPVSPILRLALRRTDVHASPHDANHITIAVVISGGNSWTDADAWGRALMKSYAPIVAIWWERDDRTRVAVGAGLAMMSVSATVAGEYAHVPRLTSESAEPSLDLAPDAEEALAFAQVNAEVAHALRSFVTSEIQRLAPSSVVDAYAGVGILSELLSAAGITVTAIEADPVGAGQATQRLGNAPASRVICDTVESALATVLPADVVVLNPPRRGVDVRVSALLTDAAKRGVRGIVYISCDPATLARDLSRLPKWRIAAIRCFDMFPQTAHVETVCVLVPELP